MTVLMEAHEVLTACAEKMETLGPGDEALAEVQTIYAVAGQVFAADIAAPYPQDTRIPIPSWLAPAHTEEKGEGRRG